MKSAVRLSVAVALLGIACSLKSQTAHDAPGQEWPDAVQPEVSGEARAAELARRLAEAERENAALRGQLRRASEEAGRASEAMRELLLRDHALGVEGLAGDERGMAVRLAAAVGELREERAARERVGAALEALAERFARALDRAGLPAEEVAVARRDIEAARAAISVEETPQAGPARMRMAKVVAVAEQGAIAVLDVGSSDELLPGMVFDVERDGKVYAVAEAVDVRRRHCAALLREVKKGFSVREGDLARVRMNKGF